MSWVAATVAMGYCFAPKALAEAVDEGAAFPGHCDHWWDAQPCCRCGTDLGEKVDSD